MHQKSEKECINLETSSFPDNSRLIDCWPNTKWRGKKKEDKKEGEGPDGSSESTRVALSQIPYCSVLGERCFTPKYPPLPGTCPLESSTLFTVSRKIIA